MLGDQIRKLRLARNINQVQLAKRLGVSKQSVSNWENNNILPSVEVLIKIAEYFGCSTDFLLETGRQRSFIDTTALTLEQTAHIQQIVSDLEKLNASKKKTDKKQQT